MLPLVVVVRELVAQRDAARSLEPGRAPGLLSLNGQQVTLTEKVITEVSVFAPISAARPIPLRRRAGLTSDVAMTPEDRRRCGTALYEEIMGRPAPTATSPRIAGLLDFVFAEVWARPGLSRRERRIISLTCAAAASEHDVLGDHVFAALHSGDLTYRELQEMVLHFAVYAGWAKAEAFDRSLDERWAASHEHSGTTLPQPRVEAHAGSTVDARARRRNGARSFEEVTCLPPADFPTPYLDAIQDFVFGEMWTRPDLSRRDRRWVTLACVGTADAAIPISSHIAAALESGDVSFEELREFVLHFATCSGWPKASAMSVALEVEHARLLAAAAGPSPSSNDDETR